MSIVFVLNFKLKFESKTLLSKKWRNQIFDLFLFCIFMAYDLDPYNYWKN